MGIPGNYSVSFVVMHMHDRFCLALSLFCVAAIPAAAGGLRATDVQGIIGVTFWEKDEMTFTQQGGPPPPGTAEADLSTMPTLGGVWSGRLTGEETGLGWEIGGLVSWVTDDAAAAAGNGVLVVAIDTSLVVFDLFVGLRMESMIRDTVRVYAAGGPLLLYGIADDMRTEEEPSIGRRVVIVDDEEGDVGVGAYGRVGIDVQVGDIDFVGLGVRAMRSELDFADTLGEVEFTGVTAELTFTRAW